MSVLFGLERGLPQTESVTLTTTNPTDIIEAIGTGKDSGIDVIGWLVCNSDSSARTITVSRFVNEDTASYPLWSAKSIPATNEENRIFPIRLAREDKIIATAGAANVLTIHVTYMQPTS